MQATHCPLCYEQLEIREVAPCMECGSATGEIDEARDGEHTYAEYRVFGDLSLVLCDFCQADFSSWDPTYFGLPLGRSVGMARGWQFIRSVEPVITKDKCCAKCGHRLSFLEFVIHARELHGQSKSMA